MSDDKRKRFFILWNPNSERPPRVRFDTEAEAQEIAEKMALTHSEPFYVCEAKSLSERGPVKTKNLR